MRKLWEVTKLIRSKNSGPFELTFDVIFKDHATYEKVRDAKLINAQWFAKTYRLQPEVVSIINYDAASAIKITIPRPAIWATSTIPTCSGAAADHWLIWKCRKNPTQKVCRVAPSAGLPP